MAAIRGLLPREDAAADLLPVLGRPDFTDAERLSVIDRGWNRITPPQRISALDLLLLDRPVGSGEPRDQVVELLRRAATDPSAAVRERTLTGISGLPAFWSSRKASQLLLVALADDTPALRRLGLALAASKPRSGSGPTRGSIWPGSWSIPMPRCDRSPGLGRAPSPGRKVPRTGETGQGPDRGSLARSPCRGRAPGRRHRSGRRPGRSLPVRPRLLSLSTFRRKVNPLFYQAGEDAYSCARCHANHTILRIAEADPAKGFTASSS